MPVSSTHRGWRYDKANDRLDIYYNGTKVGHVSATELEVDGALDVDGAANFAAEAEFAANVHIQSTLEAGADGVGADGEQLTSGGAAAECDWAAAGSLRQFKHLLGIRDDADEALRVMATTPVYDFRYKRKDEADERVTSTGDVETVYTGIVADEAPWAMHYGGRILNPINALGYTMLAIRGLLARVESLEGELKAARA